MFANFFGIVIISASALLIAGLALRSTPDLPATMNLGLVEKVVSSTSQTESSNSSEAAKVTSETAAANTEDSTSINSTTPAKVDTTESTSGQSPASSGLSKEYLEIRRRAIESSEASHTRTNKSDGVNHKDSSE